MIDIKDDHFGAVLSCAVRYAIGRSMYMTKLVIDFITPLVQGLSTKTLWCLKRDINEAAKHNQLGDAKINAPAWLELLADVRKELIKRGDVD